MSATTKPIDISKLDLNEKKSKKPSSPNPNPNPHQPTTASNLGIDVKKADDFSAWYTQVSPIKSRNDGLLRYFWLLYPQTVELLHLEAHSRFKLSIAQSLDFFGKEIEKIGVQDAYFPMLVTQGALEKEKDHVEGFSPEVAWVTRSGQSELQEPIAIRPTSETIMYPTFAKWVKSHRELPLKINQWCNVIRWEFKHPQPFLRTREFLWQEGHTVFYTKKEADHEVLQILELYRRVYEDVLAVPVIKGRKSESEKFPGGLYTTTVEAFIPESGRGIQGATSHCLGQNFAKMFKIEVEGERGEKSLVWQNSWGITTRSIGVMVMTHGDDKGLVLPPKVAAVQVVIVPCGITSKLEPSIVAAIEEKISQISTTLQAIGIRVNTDLRDNYTPGWKFNHWEVKGVPIRFELGPKDLQKNEVRVVTRHDDQKKQYSIATLSESIPVLLEKIHDDMLAAARARHEEHLEVIDQSWDLVLPALDAKKFVMIPWCERPACEKDIKERTCRAGTDEKAPAMGAKSLCIPFEQPSMAPGAKCVACGHPAVSYTLFGRSY
ncbi:hypothetical protein DI09_4p510 [Mitosporidium daphniae]|uniref:Proline--tRNA ligase n=1 Tax=Mitosporidium daphniae TaxID=1485682 RepID=A0A098VPM0_9MICR|nr:uncharacterized protein DI09_4p510 [Mitosporidium daphniae]KGG50968.1 hypothetical protein DI09_4p510 [Mitosporidium daphniae]|eukprot:XP_013237395.1 uncharacterized protein DI09_4p510 [Mitosporidium daphniae]